MATDDTPEGKPAGKARHGYRNEVSWESGQGRQPYENQPEGSESPAAAEEFDGGDRGQHSGVTQEQMEKARRVP